MSRRKWNDLRDAVMDRPGATERIAAHRAATLAELGDDLREPTWWRVTINDTETVAIEATDAARAATLAGDRWRAKHTGGVDRGGIETVHVRRDVDYV